MRRRRRRTDDYYDEIYDDYQYRKYSNYFGWYYSPYIYNRFLLTDKFYVPRFTIDNTPYIKLSSGPNVVIDSNSKKITIKPF